MNQQMDLIAAMEAADALDNIEGKPWTQHKGIAIPNYLRLETVLLIEDSDDLNRSLSLRLRHNGYEVISAFDGAQGLQKIERFDPDLIILDLGLPKLGGVKLLHELRATEGLGDAPVIVVTGLTDPALEAKTKGFGVNRFFRKPVRQKEIVRAVREILERQ